MYLIYALIDKQYKNTKLYLKTNFIKDKLVYTKLLMTIGFLIVIQHGYMELG
ncbi:hypothetical protein CQA01_27770 [Cyclobacterium qasimii]|uniref:Uncharacterized protein n=1 Tax=Cyclobacterium qasimii TaxID=1350429 RepID=A0A512CDG4_9BACT|nr:hypothetical protein CQA01_27770 [Cyclobacterium qasimii]